MATASTNLSNYDKTKLPESKDFKIGLVVSEWNNQITEGLYQGAFEAFTDCGVLKQNIIRWDVPGSFELIYGAKRMQQVKPELDAIVVIGCVIEGETKHFDFVCQGVTAGVKDLNIQGAIPVIFCVLTDHNMQQSIDRSGGKHGNKGTEAAIAAIKMAQLKKLEN